MSASRPTTGEFLPTYPPACYGSSRHPSRPVDMWTAFKCHHRAGQLGRLRRRRRPFPHPAPGRKGRCVDPCSGQLAHALRSRRSRLVVPPAAAVGRSRSAPALGGMSSSSGGIAPLRTFRLPWTVVQPCRHSKGRASPEILTRSHSLRSLALRLPVSPFPRRPVRPTYGQSRRKALSGARLNTIGEMRHDSPTSSV